MNNRIVSAWIITVVFSFASHAQPAGIIHQVPEEKQNIIETIALYDADQRTAVLEAAAHPEVLVRMGNIRANTEFLFKEKLTAVPEEDQKKIFNVTRYPDLMNAISSHREERTGEEMNELLQQFPAEIHEDAGFVNNNYFDLIVEVNQLYRQAEQDFQRMLATYPNDVRQTYSDLSKLPEIVSLLSNNLDLIILLGDEYRQHPKEVMAELDSLNIVVAEARAKELTDWKKELEANPEARQEYEQSAKEFSDNENEEEANSDDVYAGAESKNHVEEVYVHHTWNYYPYWFGWPAWYGYECWAPYPWWYHWGFYYGPYHTMVIWSFPSDFYMYWYFWYDPHMYYYPHYTDHIIHHYYGPRHIGSTIQPVYRNWERQHKRELPTNWFNDDANRVDRIREYGKFKMDYEITIRNQTDKSPSQREYLEKNSKRYPTLKPVLKERPAPTGTKSNPTRDNPPGQTKQTEPYPTRDYKPYKDKPASQKEQPHTEKPPTRDAVPSQKEQPKAPPRDAPPSQKGKDNSSPPPSQPRKD